MNKIVFAHISLFFANLIYALNYTFAKDVMPDFIQPSGFILLRVIGAVILFSISYGANINPLTYGTFWLLVTDAYNCISDTAYFVIDHVNAVAENNMINGLTIFPNPSSTLFNIQFTS